MATAQTSADKKTVGMITEVDAGGFVYTLIGGIRFYTGQGVPDHICPIGCLYVSTATGLVYACTVADGTWVEVGAQ